MSKIHILILCNQTDCKYCTEPYQKICSLDEDEKGICCHPQPLIGRLYPNTVCTSKNEKVKLPYELQSILDTLKR